MPQWRDKPTILNRGGIEVGNKQEMEAKSVLGGINNNTDETRIEKM